MLSWNCRGLGPTQNIQFLKELVAQKMPKVIFLCETLCNKEKTEFLCRSLEYEGCFVVEATGRSGGLALFWKNEDEVTIDSFSTNHIDSLVHFEGYGKFHFTGLYGEPNHSLRRNTWQLLRTLFARSKEAWCIMGDFNNVLHHSEKIGGKPYPTWLIEGFQEVTQQCGLIDLDLNGHPYTWEKSRDTPQWIEAKLDRTMVNHDWLLKFPNAKLFNMEVSPSDHSPLFLDMENRIAVERVRHFRFENCWVRFEEREAIIYNCWSNSNGLHMHQNIQLCGQALQEWGTHVSGNFSARIKSCKRELWQLKSRQDAEGKQQYVDTKQQLFEILNQREMFWRFFQTEEMPEGLNATNIVLIPKKKKPDQMSELRPISLCNVVAKVITKVLSNRMKSFLGDVISENQSAFIPGRLIADNFTISFEILHYLKRKQSGKDGFMALKLDLSKAYDRVDWHFLCAMLSRLGFDDKWVRLIFGFLSSVQYNVVSSGYTLGPITPSRGLRQGDPISPYLFLICAEGLSALIKSFEARKLIHGCKVANGAPIVSHMLFADDSFLYCKATEREVANIQHMLDVFAKASGQQVNFAKSSVFFSSNTSSHMWQTICNRMGIREADEKSKYLGLPSTIGRNKIAAFSYVVDKVHKRVQTWDNKFLSKAGKEVLIKSVVQALPAYTLNVFLLPVSICDDVERAISKFWWKSNKNKGIHWLVGDGSRVSILKDPWLKDDVNPFNVSSHPSLTNKMVNSLMEVDKIEWDNEIILDMFNDRDQRLIWQIPLSAMSTDDSWYWAKENNGFFSVKSAYRLQQKTFSRPGTNSPANLWKRLWNLKLPPKTKVPAVAPAAMLFTSWFEAGLISWREEESVEEAMVLWSIWNTRNDVVWNAKIPMMEEVTQLAKITYVDWFNAQKAAADTPKDYHEPRSDKWKAPEFPIIKAKTVCKLGALQPHEVEAMGMKEALSWIKANDWQDVIVESDYLQVISDLNCNKNMASPYGHIISDCKVLFAEIDNVSLCFVKRSANRVAHCLARSSLGEADRIFSSYSLPTVIASLVRILPLVIGTYCEGKGKYQVKIVQSTDLFEDIIGKKVIEILWFFPGVSMILVLICLSSTMKER
ncbi:uncharacterized protein LOC133035920 [Cannabis sativa]|uniref:uncharacterized protein LOC133035920 n=1 Tax=Cannabis sativa TaxID=3483 RepID=UPI0029CA58C9|nr:uncharacterized protein LOC133035920 [Cannabis sativa]